MTSEEELINNRERTIELLTSCYSNDYLSLEQFESRVERAGIAGSVEELNLLLSDVPAEYRLRQPHNSPAGTSRLTSEPKNTTSILSERRMEIDSTHSNAVAVLGSLKIVVPKLEPGSGTIYVQLAAVLSEVTIVVPNGITVDNRITPMLSEMKESASRATSSGPVLRLEGFSLMSEVKVRAGLSD